MGPSGFHGSSITQGYLVTAMYHALVALHALSITYPGSLHAAAQSRSCQPER